MWAWQAWVVSLVGLRAGQGREIEGALRLTSRLEWPRPSTVRSVPHIHLGVERPEEGAFCPPSPNPGRGDDQGEELSSFQSLFNVRINIYERR